jgi:hypothetical protein
MLNVGEREICVTADVQPPWCCTTSDIMHTYGDLIMKCGANVGRTLFLFRYTSP